MRKQWKSCHGRSVFECVVITISGPLRILIAINHITMVAIRQLEKRVQEQEGLTKMKFKSLDSL